MMERTVKVRMVIFGKGQVVTIKVPVTRIETPEAEIIRRAGNALREAADTAQYTVEAL